MSYNVPIAVLVGLVVLLSFGATAAAAETDTRVGVCVVGDSPCNDPGDTPTADRPVDDDTPIQFHPDELPYASGLADGDDSNSCGPSYASCSESRSPHGTGVDRVSRQ